MLLEGRYRYARELGRGGSGRVVLAHDVRDEAPRALKIVPPEALGTLELELDVLRRVAHPTLATVFELLRLSEPLGAPFRLPAGAAVLVEAFVEGTRSDVALGALASDDTRWRLAMRVARDVLIGLARLHSVGLVHGDVSPANVLVRAEGQPLAVLVDLGLAGPPLGADGLARGTRGFLAPEAAVGARTQGTDLFGLGASLRSWLGDGAQVPSALAALVGDLHAVDPRDRPKTAAEALEALSSIAATLGEPWEPADAPLAVVEPVYVGDAARVASAVETLERRGWLRVGGPRGSGRSRFAREVAAALQARRRREGRRVPTFVRVDAPDDVATLEAASSVVHVEGGTDAFDVARRAEEVGGRERLWILEGASPADVELEALDDASFEGLARGLGVTDIDELRRRSARLAGRACRLVLGTPTNDDDAPSWAEERLDVAGGVLPSSVAGDVRALVREGRVFVQGDRVILRADRRGVADPAVHATRAAEVRRRLAARGHPHGPWDAYLARAAGEADAAERFARFAAKALEEGRTVDALELSREAGPAHRELEARALARSARYGEALAAAAELPGVRGAALRAELARRQGDTARAAREAAEAGDEGADTLGWLALGRGDVDAARAHARAPDLRAWIALSSGRPDEARVVVDEVLGRSEPRAAEGRETRARVAIAAGALEQSRGELVRAAEHHASAFVSARAVGDVHLAATAAANEGIVALDAGRLAEGRRALRESARRYVRIGRARDLGRALLNLASVASWIGDDEGAEWHVQRAGDACREAGDELGLGYVALVELELTLRRGALDALPPLLRALEGADARARCRAAAWLATSRPELSREWLVEGPPFERAYAEARLALATNRLSDAHEARVRLEPRTWEESWLAARLDLDLATARADERALDEALRGLRALLDRTSRHLDADQRRALRRHPALTRAWAARPAAPVGGDDPARWRRLATLAATWVDRDATEIVESGLELARDATDAERAFVVARASDGTLEVRAARSSPEGELEARPSRSVVARALASGALVTTVDALGDEEWGGAQSVHA
ncbi:MAG: hypothetical protein H6724_14260, partial [Sandaracinus sp.]|nr:hypothetical protein [Sandaracinus sp.]